MKAMILGIVADLRARKLLPVAVGLILALVAAPVLLLEPAQEAPGGPAPSAAPERSSLAAVELENQDAGSSGSSLAEFDTRDPFAARRPRRRSDAEQAPGPSADGGESAPSPSPTPSADAAAESRVPLKPLSPAPSPARPNDAPSPEPRRVPKAALRMSEQKERAEEDQEMTETVDVKAGRRGDERLRRYVKRLDLLPSERSPLLVFVGTSLSGRSAVFLVDADLTVSGDGACEPSPRNCSFLTLRPDRRHDQAFFEDSKGRKWSLKLLEIGEMPVERALEQQTARAKVARAASSRGSRAASFAVPALATGR